jgi:NadR type nicotinamide-nucleotide adenylyltransferase
MRIAVTGPESSGKTTLSLHLAEILNAAWAHEFARTYLTDLKRPYQAEDLVDIAKGQIAAWQEAANEPVLICDTEMLVMKVWSEFKFGTVDPFILQQLEQQRFDLYLLCKPDIPWEEDPLREHPEKRNELFEIYHTQLKEMNVTFVVLEGDMDQRLGKALSVIESLNRPS